MNSILDVLSSETWMHLIVSLLHTLWLGVVFALALAVCLRALPAHRPDLKYGISVLTLVALFASWPITFRILEIRHAPVAAREMPSRPALASAVPERMASSFHVPATSDQSEAEQAPSQAKQRWTAILALGWLAGLAVMSLRLTAQWIDLQRLRQALRPVEDSALLKLVDDLRAQLNLSRIIRIASGSAIRMLSVFGFLSPTVCVPLSMVTGVPPEQLRAVLAHEFAHIRRHDYLVNLGQQVIEALLFFNPAVWWISRQIRIEREACCDAIASGVVGSPASYASALADWIEHYHSPAPDRDLQMAFGGDGKESGMIDRMKRLLLPEYRPSIRLPWYSLLSMLIVSAALLATWKGSTFAVAKAAEWLTPEQRIEKMAAIEQSHGQELKSRREYTSKDDITIFGDIRTADGSPLPSDAFVNTVVVRPGYQGYGGAKVKMGKFRSRLTYGKVFIAAGAKGFAPTFVGPLKTEPGETNDTIHIVLEKGFSSAIKIVSDDGKPLPNVHLSRSYQHEASFNPIESVTDGDGLVKVDHVAAMGMQWKATASGFQYEEHNDVMLPENGVWTWKLHRAAPTEGVIVDRITGTGISGATIKLMHRKPAFHTMYGDAKWAPVLATSKDGGRFILDTLNTGSEHLIFVEAPGFAPKLIYNVRAGQDDLRISLGPEIHVQGKVVGDLSQLENLDGKTVVSVCSPFEADGTHEYSISIPVTVQNGEATFRANGLREGRFIVRAGPKRLEMQLERSVDDLVIQLGNDAASEAASSAKTGSEVRKREVVIQLVPPAGMPVPKGQLAVSAWTRKDPETIPRGIDVENGAVHLQVSVPGLISFEPTGLVGYWVAREFIVEVPEGAGPFILKRDVLPAGSIFGTVTDANNADLSGVMVSVVEIATAPGKGPGALGELGKNRASPNDGPTRFTAQPLPLGGQYELVAYRGNSYASSPVITLTEKDPIQEIRMTLPRGVDLDGRVLDPAGRPVVGIKVELRYHALGNHSFIVSDSPLTDNEGHFHWSGVNPDVAGNYTVEIQGQAGFQRARQEVRFGTAQEITLRKGESLSGVVVNDATGNPLAGVELYAYPAEPKVGDSSVEPMSKTDNDGHFEFNNLDRREYWLGSRSGMIKNGMNQRISIRGGQKKLVKVYLEPSKGAVLWESGKQINQ